MCSGPAGESWGHLLPGKGGRLGRLRVWGFVDIPKVHDHHSTQGQPSCIPPREPLGWRGLREREGENAEKEETSVPLSAPRKPPRRPESCSGGWEGHKHRVD